MLHAHLAKAGQPFAPAQIFMKFILKIALVFSFVKVLKFVEISMKFTSAISFSV